MKELLAELLAGIVKAVMQQALDSLLTFRLTASDGEKVNDTDAKLRERLKKDGWK